MSINKDEFIESLENYLMEEEAKELEINLSNDIEDENAPIIDSLQKANYFLKLINVLKKDIDDINSMCDKEIEKTSNLINSYREKSLKTLNKQVDYYSELLKSFTLKELEYEKKRSIKLPYGTLSIKKQQPKWDYGDETDLIQWFKENDELDFINKKESFSLNKKLIKEKANLIDENIVIGDKLIPNVTITQQEDKFIIK